MPHIEPIWIYFCVLVVVAFFLWSSALRGSDPAQIERMMSKGLYAMQSSQWEEAEAHLEAAMRLIERDHNPDVTKTISCMLALAQCYERAGKYKDAENIFPRVLSTWEKHLNNSGSAMVDIDYAATHADFGRGTYDVCEFYLQKVIPNRETRLPRGHQDISNSYVIAAGLLRKLGRKEEAEALDAKLAGKK